VLDFVALQVGIFLNRLSDYLFTAARFAVSMAGAAAL
jgi:cob(I)alamin adenosyltransferase